MAVEKFDPPSDFKRRALWSDPQIYDPEVMKELGAQIASEQATRKGGS